MSHSKGIATALIASSLGFATSYNVSADIKNCAMCQLMAKQQAATSPLSSQSQSLGFNIAGILHPTITPPRFDFKNYHANWNPANPSQFSTSVYDLGLTPPTSSFNSQILAMNSPMNHPDTWAPAWNAPSAIAAPALPPMILHPSGPIFPQPASLLTVLNSAPAASILASSSSDFAPL